MGWIDDPAAHYVIRRFNPKYSFGIQRTADCQHVSTRERFQQLLAHVAMGTVGIVLSREPSRLSRTDRDWCHLPELCHVFNTLVAGADNLYDLNHRLVLGIKGTLSVVELKVLKL
jgi:DNA invertase Pin-like site-specific DNA recombinase